MRLLNSRTEQNREPSERPLTHPAGRQGQEGRDPERPRGEAGPRPRCFLHVAFLELPQSHHFYGPAFPLPAIFVISLETIKCPITLVFFFKSKFPVNYQPECPRPKGRT